MSENKLPEGFMKELNDEEQSNLIGDTNYQEGYSDGLNRGAQLFASYIAKQEPVGYRHKFNHGSFLRSIDLIEMKDNWQPLYTHPSPLESENKRLRDALEEIANWKTPKTGKYWQHSAETEDNEMSYEACDGSNGVRDYFKKLATNALNR